MPSKAKPGQAKLSQAKQSQAKPRQTNGLQAPRAMGGYKRQTPWGLQATRFLTGSLGVLHCHKQTKTHTQANKPSKQSKEAKQTNKQSTQTNKKTSQTKNISTQLCLS